MKLGRAGNWSLRRVLWLCFLPLVAILVVMAVVSFWQIGQISGDTADIVDVRHPLETIVLDMRLAVGELEQAVADYSRYGDVAYANRAREQESEFGSLAQEFSGLADTDEEKQAGQELLALYYSFKGSADGVFRPVDLHGVALDQFHDQVATIASQIDDTLRATDMSAPDAGQKLAATLDMNASLGKVSSAVESYTTAPDAALRQDVVDAQASFQQSVAAYRETEMSDYEDKWLALLEENFEVAASDAVATMDAGDDLRAAVSQFEASVAMAITYLDGSARPLLSAETAAAADAAQSTAATAQRLVIILAVVSLVVAVASVLALARMVVRPVRGIVEGAEAVDSGKLDYRFDIDARGEFGELAFGLNRMLDGLQRSKAVLGESEETAWQILDSTTDAVILTDLRGLILASNEMAAQRYGRSLEQMIDTNFYDLLPEDLRASRKAQIADVIRTGKSFHFEDEREGMVLDHRVYPVHGARGEVSRIAIFARDVTMHKWVDEVTEQLRRRNELILEAAGEGIYGLDTEGKTTFVNPSAAEMLGYRPEDLIGRLHHELVHHSRPDGRAYPQSQCPIYAACKDGTVHTSVDNEVFWRKDGTSFPVEYTSTPIIDKGKIVGAVVTFRDITERKRMEDLLRKSEERYRSVFEAAVNLIVSVDREGTIIDCNTRSQEILGYAPKEVIGRSLLEFIHPDDREKAQVSLDEVLSKGFDYHKRYKMVRKDGSLVDVQINAAAAKDSRGEYIRTICMIDHYEQAQ